MTMAFVAGNIFFLKNIFLSMMGKQLLPQLYKQRLK